MITQRHSQSPLNSTMVEVEFDWPWQYDFPPFFTLQPHPETRAKQFLAWRNLILLYCKKFKLYILDVTEAPQMPLFHNSSINRKLDPSVIISLLTELQKTKNAAAIDKRKNRWEIYWHTLDEWASLIYDFICDKGMQNTVVTLYELSKGDDVQDQEFAGIDNDILIKVLKVLESQQKCELIFTDGIEGGVKFF